MSGLMAPPKKSPNGRLKEGDPMGLRPLNGDASEATASVTKISGGKVELALSKPLPSVPFKQGEKLRLRFWDEEAIYLFDSEIQEVSGKKGETIVVLLPVDAVSVQRRSGRRSRIAVPFSFKVLDASHQRIVSDQLHKSKTINLSLSGLRFDTHLPFKEGDQLEVALQLSRTTSVSLRSTVTSVGRSEEKGRLPFLVGVEFFDLSAEERKKLSEFLAESQRKG